MQKLKNDPGFTKFYEFYMSLKKSDKDKIMREISLRTKLIYELPKALREARQEYRELILNNKELFDSKARLRG